MNLHDSFIVWSVFLLKTHNLRFQLYLSLSHPGTSTLNLLEIISRDRKYLTFLCVRWSIFPGNHHLFPPSLPLITTAIITHIDKRYFFSCGRGRSPIVESPSPLFFFFVRSLAPFPSPLVCARFFLRKTGTVFHLLPDPLNNRRIWFDFFISNGSFIVWIFPLLVFSCVFFVFSFVCWYCFHLNWSEHFSCEVQFRATFHFASSYYHRVFFSAKGKWIAHAGIFPKWGREGK